MIAVLGGKSKRSLYHCPACRPRAPTMGCLRPVSTKNMRRTADAQRVFVRRRCLVIISDKTQLPLTFSDLKHL